MKKVKYSKSPLAHQLPIMADNLVEVNPFNYARVSVEATNYGTGPAKFEYEIAIQPGLDGSECSVHTFPTWRECQDFYFQLIKGE